jgi:DNA invertase Pin-like site-specific DNA recombinase
MKNITEAGQRGITVVYLRTASANPHDSRLGIQRQLRACERFARNLGWSLSGVYADVGISGLSENRSALAQMMRDLSRGHIRRVVVADPARLARSVSLGRRLVERIRRQGASLTFPGDGQEIN